MGRTVKKKERMATARKRAKSRRPLGHRAAKQEAKKAEMSA